MIKRWAAISIGFSLLFGLATISACSTKPGNSSQPVSSPQPTFTNALQQIDLPSPGGGVLTNLSLGLSFPPVKNSEERAFTLEQLEALGIEHIRIAEDWSYREPTEGEFKWEPLDKRIEWVTQNEISLLLTIQSNGPAWACDPGQRNERSCVYRNPGDFETYISELLLRYPDQIEKIQFGNEWASDYWYPGTAEEFAIFNNILYQAVKQYSPRTEVVLGGLSTDQVRVLAFCQGVIEEYYRIDGELIGKRDDQICSSEDFTDFVERLDYVIQNAEYDLIDFHFYDDAEAWPLYFQAAFERFPEPYPVIISEFGGPNLYWEQPYSDQLQAERLEEYLNILSEMEVSEAYYFKLVQSYSAHPSHHESGLFRELDGGLIAKPAFFVFQGFSQGK
jgi:hypothetical protein